MITSAITVESDGRLSKTVMLMNDCRKWECLALKNKYLSMGDRIRDYPSKNEEHFSVFPEARIQNIGRHMGK
jgi:hypothetical protein